MTNQLFPYQIEGAEWLSQRRFALLADEMGLGKSATLIVEADLCGDENILVLGPAVSRIKWTREWSTWQTQHRTVEPIMSRSAPVPSTNVVVSSYDMLHDKDVLKGLLARKWDKLILDESHYLKSLTAARSLHTIGRHGLIHRAKCTRFVTGTPMPNHPGELWPMLYVTGTTKMPYDDWVDAFCVTKQTPYGPQITGMASGVKDDIRVYLDGFMLRRKTKEVCPEMPDIFFTDLPLDVTQKVEGLSDLERMWDAAKFDLDALARIDDPDGHIATIRKELGLSKSAAVADVVSGELHSGAYNKIVIFAWHRGVIRELHERLKFFRPAVVLGGMSNTASQAQIDFFQNDPSCHVMIGQIQACGTTIELTAANHVLFAERDWTPSNNAQAAKRAHRIGQDKPVFVRFASVAGTVDESIARTCRRKTGDAVELGLG